MTAERIDHRPTVEEADPKRPPVETAPILDRYSWAGKLLVQIMDDHGWQTPDLVDPDENDPDRFQIGQNGKGLAEIWINRLREDYDYSLRQVLEIVLDRRGVITENVNQLSQAEETERVQALQRLDRVYQSVIGQVRYQAAFWNNRNTVGISNEQNWLRSKGHIVATQREPGVETFYGFSEKEWQLAHQREQAAQKRIREAGANQEEPISRVEEAKVIIKLLVQECCQEAELEAARIIDLLEEAIPDEPKQEAEVVEAVLVELGLKERLSHFLRRLWAREKERLDQTPDPGRRKLVMGLAAGGGVVGLASIPAVRWVIRFARGLLKDPAEVQPMGEGKNDGPPQGHASPQKPEGNPTSQTGSEPGSEPSPSGDHNPENQANPEIREPAKNIADYFLRILYRYCQEARARFAPDRLWAIREHLNIPRINLLLVGLDASEAREGILDQIWELARSGTRGLADHVYFLSIGLDGSVICVSIPRSLRLQELREHYQNSAYTLNSFTYLRHDMEHDPKNLTDQDYYPRELIRRIVEQATGLPVDITLQFTLDGAKKVLEALFPNGLTFDIPKDLSFKATIGDEDLDGDGQLDLIRLSQIYEEDIDRLLNYRWFLGSNFRRLPQKIRDKFLQGFEGDYNVEEIIKIINEAGTWRARLWEVEKRDFAEDFVPALREFLREQGLYFPEGRSTLSANGTLRFVRTRKANEGQGGNSAAARTEALFHTSKEVFWGLVNRVFGIRKPVGFDQIEEPDEKKRALAAAVAQAGPRIPFFPGRLEKLVKELTGALRWEEAFEHVVSLTEIGEERRGENLSGDEVTELKRYQLWELLRVYWQEFKRDFLNSEGYGKAVNLVRAYGLPLDFERVVLEQGVDYMACTLATCNSPYYHTMRHMSPLSIAAPSEGKEAPPEPREIRNRILEYWEPMRRKINEALARNEANSGL